MDQIIFGPNYILLKTLDFGSNYFLDQMSRTESWTKLFLDQIILDQIIPVHCPKCLEKRRVQNQLNRRWFSDIL